MRNFLKFYFLLLFLFQPVLADEIAMIDYNKFYYPNMVRSEQLYDGRIITSVPTFMLCTREILVKGFDCDYIIGTEYFECINKTYAIGSLAEYETPGRLINRGSVVRLEFKNIPLGTKIEDLYNQICRAK